ncbi:uncharacterized protein MONBRDRAFT_30292 [Monosiga brevicollis MX1]|uniref:Carboxylic ester hydrolase n=1 Tax=Monosiga brevicollis TaxID=81824 RepID=A9VDJ5_MONBE|nr:uncharacterized protein MONBRDRAFT_30292 [Monosiga brevicollis MX1]EDQ84403.1 predicted protein [Monosiga brevicollis MX1]|eukprot:XP_001750804.1 hypothetical protein [Monosiga brevicollis MX1]
MKVTGLAVLALVALLGGARAEGLQVKTTNGVIEGFATNEADIWMGIPYALPPVDNLRWQNPEPMTNWPGVREAKSFGPACPQKCELPPLACQDQISEDCLYLNVFAAKNVRNASVLVWIHGGRFEQGSEGVELYDARYIANFSNTVVVTINYRLGVLGFLTLPSGFIGNYALRDQRLALQWVQANIARFGGNPDQVTIFGQSAGGTSVSAHLTSERSYGLFSGAIIQSSPYALPLLKTEDAYGHYDHFVQETDCQSASDTACLLNLSWHEVIDAEISAQAKLYLERPLIMFFPWTPVIDGYELTTDPLTAINRGEHAKVPIVIGNVAEEAWIFVFTAFPKLNKLEAEALIDVIFRNHDEPKGIYDLYKIPDQADDYRPWISEVATDFIMLCTSRNASAAWEKSGMPVYRYEFNHSWSMKGAWGPANACCEGHACHGVELPFVFDSANLLNYTFDDGEQVLARDITTAWGVFANTFSPNANGLPQWPQNKPSEDDAILWYSSVDTQVKTQFRKKFCDFWDAQGYIF